MTRAGAAAGDETVEDVRGGFVELDVGRHTSSALPVALMTAGVDLSQRLATAAMDREEAVGRELVGVVGDHIGVPGENALADRAQDRSVRSATTRRRLRGIGQRSAT